MTGAGGARRRARRLDLGLHARHQFAHITGFGGEDFGPERDMLPTEAAVERARQILEALRNPPTDGAGTERYLARLPELAWPPEEAALHWCAEARLMDGESFGAALPALGAAPPGNLPTGKPRHRAGQRQQQ